MSSGVNMLTNNLKVLYNSKKDFLKLIFFKSAQKL